jgi:hypothetical protein
LLAAVELDLFSKISQGANTEEKLSTALGISSLNAERITVACLGLGLITRDEDKIKKRNRRRTIFDKREKHLCWRMDVLYAARLGKMGSPLRFS